MPSKMYVYVMRTNSLPRAASYSRISVKDVKVPKVQNQQADVVKLCKTHEYTLTADRTLSDDGVSAYKADVERPGFDALRKLIESGGCDVVVAVAADRLTRRPIEALEFAALCAHHGVRVHTVREGIQSDDEDTNELLTFLNGWKGKKEVKDNIKRRTAANEKLHQAGGLTKTGPTPFGWKSDRMTLDEPAAELIRQGCQMIRENQSVHQVVLAWRASSVKPARAKEWGRISVIKTLTRWRNAGVVSHMDKPVLNDEGGHVRGPWDEIVALDELEDVRSILLARSGEKRIASRLCSGIARCSCGEYLVGSGSRGKRTYMCSARTRGVARPGPHGGINAETLDTMARDLVISRYFAPDLTANAGADEKAASVAALHQALAEVRAKQAKLLDAFTDTDMSQAAYAKKYAQLFAREQEIELALAEAASASAHVRMLDAARHNFWGAENPRSAAKTELTARFENLTLDDQRGLLRSIARLTVRPSTGSKDTGSQRVTVEHL